MLCIIASSISMRVSIVINHMVNRLINQSCAVDIHTGSITPYIDV